MSSVNVKDKKVLAIFVLTFGVIGTILLFKSFASTPSVSFEPENGALSGAATVGSDSSASGGKYIQFGSSNTGGGGGGTPTPPPSGKSKPVFIIYYMWWDHSHWTSHLGSNYPYSQSPNPLPATLDASSCGTVNKYSGNVLTDVSQGLKYDQNTYQTFVDDVKAAAATGATGFAVNWVGNGSTSQSASSVPYDQRLAYMFQAVHAYNAAGGHFKLMVNYQSSAKILSMTQFQNDFAYLKNTYGNDSALDHTWSSKPEVIIAGTWKYTDSDLNFMGSNLRSSFYLIGDEKPATWDAARVSNLDGTSYYWSSQDPYKNASSFSTLQSFASTIHSAHKTWFAPFTPGYNAMLIYGTSTCVPRNSGQTMHALFDGNLASNPDGWTFISWNEISEGTYIVPLTRYNTFYTSELQQVIANNK